MRQTSKSESWGGLEGFPFTAEEVAILIQLVAKHDPDQFVKDAAKAVIYKAKALVGES
jgi:hypothetical protein